VRRFEIDNRGGARSSARQALDPYFERRDCNLGQARSFHTDQDSAQSARARRAAAARAIPKTARIARGLREAHESAMDRLLP
jgi:hypothetical protein